MAEKLHKLVQNIFSSKFFSKIFLCFIGVIVLVFVVIYFILSSYSDNMITEREMKYNRIILQNTDDYVQNKLSVVKSISVAMYNNQDTAKNVMSFLEHPIDLSDYADMELKRDFDTYFFSAFGNDTDISSITVRKTLDGNAYSYSREQSAAGGSSPAFASDGRNYATNNLSVFPSGFKPFEVDHNRVTYMVSTQIGSKYESKKIAEIYVEFTAEGITKYLEKYRDDLLGDVLVLTPERKVLYDSTGQYYNQVFQIDTEAGVVKLNGETNYINAYTQGENGFLVLGLIPQSQLLAKTQPIRNVIIIFTVICLLTLLALIYFTMRIFSKRMNRITDAIANVRNNNLEERIPVDKVRDEFDELSIVFNGMCDDLKTYIDKYYIADIQQKDAMLSALEAQINPHFLSNTLEAIRMKAVANDDREAADMIYILSRLFRSSIHGSSIVTVREEIRYCKMYLELFKIRYGESLNVTFHVEPDILAYSVPKNILQPIMENYIIHGFIPDNQNNQLWLRAKQVRGYIVFLIRDNGAGMTKDKLEKIRNALSMEALPKENIGLVNIHRRLRLMYDKTSGLKIYSRHNGGTAVVLKISQGRMERKDG